MKTNFSNEIATVPRKAKAKLNDNNYEYKCTIPLVSVLNETVSEEERKPYLRYLGQTIRDGHTNPLVAIPPQVGRG